MNLDWNKSIGDCIQTRHQLMSSLDDLRNVDRLQQVVVNSIVNKDNLETYDDHDEHVQAQETFNAIVQAFEISKSLSQHDRLIELWYSVCKNLLEYDTHHMQLKQVDNQIKFVDIIKKTSYTRNISISTIQLTSPNGTRYSMEILPYTEDVSFIHSTLDTFAQVQSHQVRILILDKMYIVGVDAKVLPIDLYHGNPQGNNLVHALTSSNTNISLLNHII